MNEQGILVSYDVVSLFTNVPLEEAIHILADKAFSNDWLNKTYGLCLEKEQLIELLRAATADKLFQFNGVLYEQKDSVAMGSPLGPLLANVFMCSLEGKLHDKDEMAKFYKRFVDDSCALCPVRMLLPTS